MNLLTTVFQHISIDLTLLYATHGLLNFKMFRWVIVLSVQSCFCRNPPQPSQSVIRYHSNAVDQQQPHLLRLKNLYTHNTHTLNYNYSCNSVTCTLVLTLYYTCGLFKEAEQKIHALGSKCPLCNCVLGNFVMFGLAQIIDVIKSRFVLIWVLLQHIFVVGKLNCKHSVWIA